MIKTVRGEYTSENFRPQRAKKKSSSGMIGFMFFAFIAIPPFFQQRNASWGIAERLFSRQWPSFSCLRG
jgi:hypothetical protein